MTWMKIYKIAIRNIKMIDTHSTKLTAKQANYFQTKNLTNNWKNLTTTIKEIFK